MKQRASISASCLIAIAIMILFFKFSNAQTDNAAHRGMYVDHLMRHIYIPGQSVIDLNYSLLGTGAYDPVIELYEREEELLEYCYKNHITYLVLYDLKSILGDNIAVMHPNGSTLGENLSRFMKVANSRFGIEEFGAAVSGSDEWDLVTSSAPPPNPNARLSKVNAMTLTVAELATMGTNTALHNAIQNPTLDVSSPYYRTAIQAREIVNINRFNGGYATINFKRCVTENEFWGSGTSSAFIAELIDLRTLFPGILIDGYFYYMRDLYGSQSNPVLGKIFDGGDPGTTDSYGQSNVPYNSRLVDRFLLATYRKDDAVNENPFQNNSYFHYLLSSKNDVLKGPNTTDRTVVHSMFSAEAKKMDGTEDYNGYWITEGGTSAYKPLAKNIFAVENAYYKGWRSYPTTDVTSPEENVVTAGASQWFTSSHMVNYFKDPAIFYRSDAGGCISSGSQTVEFTYCGPGEKNTTYYFEITHPILGPVYSVSGTVNDLEADPTRPLIDPANLSCILQFHNDAYTAELRLCYKDHQLPMTADAGVYTYSQEFTVNNTPEVIAIGDLRGANWGCQSEHVILVPSCGGIVQWTDNTINSGSPMEHYIIPYANGDGIAHSYSFIKTGCTPTPRNITMYQNPAWTQPDPYVTSINCDPNSKYVTLEAHSTYSQAQILLPDGSIGGNPAQFIARDGGKYSFTLINQNGCKHHALYYVPDPPHISVNTGSCVPNWSLSATSIFTGSPTTRQWYLFDPVSGSWGSGISGATNTTYSATTPGYYRFQVVKNYINPDPQMTKCRNASRAVPFAITDAPGAITIVHPTCDGSANGSISIDADLIEDETGSTNYAGPNSHLYEFNFGSGWSTTSSISGLTAGIHDFLIRQDGSCVITVPCTLLVQQLHVAATVTNVSCFGGNNGAVNLSASGGTSPYVFTWDPPLSTTGNSLSNLFAGTYTGIATDNGSGCNTPFSIAVGQPSQPLLASIAVANTYNETCAGNDGGAMVSAFGGTEPYSYLWIPGNAVTYDVINLTAGTYNVTVTDANSCTSATSVSIGGPNSFTADIESFSSETCGGGNNGSATVRLTGGESPFYFSWSSGSQTQSAHNLAAGNYTCTVTDYNGCTATANVSIGVSSSTALPATPLAYKQYFINSTYTVLSGTTLTLDNCTLAVSPGASIVVQNNATLEIKNRALIYGCGGQWSGIIVESGADIIIENLSCLKDAETAVELQPGADVVELKNSFFLNNAMDIFAHDGSFSSAEIHGNRFTNSRQPFEEGIPFTHIQLINVSAITIGDASEERNYFSNSKYAIYSKASTFSANFNTFENIGVNEHEEPGIIIYAGAGIYADNDWLNPNTTVDIGGSLYSMQNCSNTANFTSTFECNYLTDGNIFVRCPYGIFLLNQINSNIYYNYFSNVPNAILISEPRTSTVVVSNNMFASFRYGITVYNAPNGNVSIGENSFNYEPTTGKYGSYANPDFSFADPNYFGIKCISLQNARLDQTSFNIGGNHMANSRYGIHLRNIQGVNGANEIGNSALVGSFSNQIHYLDIPRPVDAQAPVIGYWMENCDNILASNNYALYDVTPSQTFVQPQASEVKYFRGFSVDNTKNSLLCSNKAENIASGVYVYNLCTGTYFKGNNSSDSYDAYRLSNATIPDQTDGTSSFDFDNQWNSSLGFDFNGTIPPGARFWFKSSAVSVNTNPGLTSLGFNTPNSSSTDNSCLVHPIPPEEKRDEDFGEALSEPIVGEGLSEENNYLCKEGFYLEARNNATILTLGAANDVLYQSAFDELDATNVGKIADVKEEMDEGDAITAEIINNSITPTNLAETNSKAINELMLAYVDSGELSSVQKTLAHSISIQTIVEGGTDIYSIRALLNEDIIDDIELSYTARKANDESQPQKQRVFEGLVYPNPAKDEITYVCGELGDEEAMLEVYDTFGKHLASYEIQNGIVLINTSAFDPGIYFYTCKIHDGVKQSDRFTIIK